MTENEKAAIIGCWINRGRWEQIAKIFGISETYVRLIVGEYLAKDFDLEVLPPTE